MARIILGSYMIRYPMGGMLSWAFQFLKGFQQLGHDVFFVEKANYEKACYDPVVNEMVDDCTTGIEIVKELMERLGLGQHWAFVDYSGSYYGLTQESAKEVFRTADIFIDMGAHGSWAEEAQHVPVRVLLEGEPGYTQMKMEKERNGGEQLVDYDFYYTSGRQIGTAASSVPVAGQTWGHLWNLVVTDLFEVHPRPQSSAFTTIMNWQSHAPLEFNGVTYGQKDIEFEQFINLPKRVDVPMEVAVSGKVPHDRLLNCGWHIRDANTVTRSITTYYDYIYRSSGEFSVCKNVFVKTRSGWFSDRSAAYLASGRPVVVQDTGFSNYLPCGEGLFAVNNEEEAIDAIERITSDYTLHSKAARRTAEECLDAKKLLRKFMAEIS